MKVKWIIRPVVAVAFCISLFLTGCSSLGFFGKKGAPEGQPRILPSDIAKKEIVVARQEIVRRLQERGVADGVRLIPILKSQNYEGDNTPEYRIFGVKSQSVYQLLGLENADVIVSAHGFVIRDPRVFPEYVALLKVQPSGSIEIRRNGRPILMAITIKD
jgi:type II secretory pathway component PulC